MAGNDLEAAISDFKKVVEINKVSFLVKLKNNFFRKTKLPRKTWKSAASVARNRKKKKRKNTRENFSAKKTRFRKKLYKIIICWLLEFKTAQKIKKRKWLIIFTDVRIWRSFIVQKKWVLVIFEGCFWQNFIFWPVLDKIRLFLAKFVFDQFWLKFCRIFYLVNFRFDDFVFGQFHFWQILKRILVFGKFSFGQSIHWPIFVFSQLFVTKFDFLTNCFGHKSVLVNKINQKLTSKIVRNREWVVENR